MWFVYSQPICAGRRESEETDWNHKTGGSSGTKQVYMWCQCACVTLIAIAAPIFIAILVWSASDTLPTHCTQDNDGIFGQVWVSPMLVNYVNGGFSLIYVSYLVQCSVCFWRCNLILLVRWFIIMGRAWASSKLLIYYLVMGHSWICHCWLFKQHIHVQVAKSSPIPAISPARVAIVATHTWTKLYIEIVN